MKKFVTDNLAIVAAIVLPLLLVALFAVSSLVTNRVVADPQYDFLVATNFYGGSNEAFYFDVVQNRLKISYAFPVQVILEKLGLDAPRALKERPIWIPATTVAALGRLEGPDRAG